MKITYDKSVDAAYIYLTETTDTKSAKTYTVDPLEIGGMINLDFDTQGKLIGIEVMDASSKLSEEVLSNSEFSKDQLITFSNASNEILNGLAKIEEWEFRARIGVNKEDAQSLFEMVQKKIE